MSQQGADHWSGLPPPWSDEKANEHNGDTGKDQAGTPTVVRVVRPGYDQGEGRVRPASVVVSTGPPQ